MGSPQGQVASLSNISSRRTVYVLFTTHNYLTNLVSIWLVSHLWIDTFCFGKDSELLTHLCKSNDFHKSISVEWNSFSILRVKQTPSFCDSCCERSHCPHQNYTHTYSSPCFAFSWAMVSWFVDILMKNYTSTSKSKTRGWIGMGIVLMQTL